MKPSSLTFESAILTAAVPSIKLTAIDHWRRAIVFNNLLYWCKSGCCPGTLSTLNKSIKRNILLTNDKNVFVYFKLGWICTVLSFCLLQIKSLQISYTQIFIRVFVIEKTFRKSELLAKQTVGRIDSQHLGDVWRLRLPYCCATA